MKKLIIFFIISNSFLCLAQNLDPTFGANGMALNQFSTSKSDDSITAAALQTDGNLIITGSYSDSINTYGFIARILPSGSLDTSFHTFGFNTHSIIYEALAVQSDGKILAGGSNIVVRYNSNGIIDTTFGSLSGISSLNLNGNKINIKTVSILNNGKILISGYVTVGTNNDFALVKLNSDGTLDNQFDSDGIATLPISSSNELLITCGIQTDGKIVLSGTQNTNNIICRFSTTGVLDTSFGVNGIVTSTVGIQSLDFQSDGKIITAGIGSGILNAKRYFTDGSLDTTFNITMTSYLTPPDFKYNRPQIKYLNSGKILISGTYRNIANAGVFALNQFNLNGTLDTSFSNTGTLYPGNGINDSTTRNNSNILLIKPDGKIITGGNTYNITPPTPLNLYIKKTELIQISTTGTVESINDINIIQSFDWIDKVIEQTSGKTVALISRKIGFTNSSILVRYNQNGTIDNSFGTTGIVDLSTVGDRGEGTVLKKQLDGKILVGSNYGSILRFSIDGVLDTTFGTNSSGYVTIPPDYGNYSTYIDDVVVKNNGNIYIAFDNTNSSGLLSMGVKKLNSDGSIVSTYGINGTATTRFDFFNSTESEFPTTLILNPDDSIIVAGPLYTGGYYSAPTVTGLVKFNSFGLIDNSFGTNGKVIPISNNNSTVYEYPYNLLTDSNLNLFLCSTNSNIGGSIIKKYFPNGTIDLSYGTNGIVTDNYNNLSKIIIQSDNKIIKGGQINSGFGMTRYNTNGTLDSTFGISGVINTNIYYNSAIRDFIILNSGKLLAAGFSFNGTNYQAALTRYTNLNLDTLEFSTNENNFMFYPNPIQEQAIISYKLKETTEITIEVIDLQGKVIQSIIKEKNQIAGEYEQQIILPSIISSGNYILRFSSPSGNKSIKIIKK